MQQATTIPIPNIKYGSTTYSKTEDQFCELMDQIKYGIKKIKSGKWNRADYSNNNVFSNVFMVPNDTLNKNITFEIDRYPFTRCINDEHISYCSLEFDDLVEFTITHTVSCY